MYTCIQACTCIGFGPACIIVLVLSDQVYSSLNVFPPPPQQIDEMLSGSLSQEDEEAVLAELEAITQVRSSLAEQVSAYVPADSFSFLLTG